MSPSLLLDMRLMCHGQLQIVQVSIICTLPTPHLQPQAGHKAKVLTELLLPVQIHDLSSNSFQFHQLLSYVYRQNKTIPLKPEAKALYIFSATVKITRLHKVLHNLNDVQFFSDPLICLIFTTGQTVLHC